MIDVRSGILRMCVLVLSACATPTTGTDASNVGVDGGVDAAAAVDAADVPDAGSADDGAIDADPSDAQGWNQCGQVGLPPAVTETSGTGATPMAMGGPITPGRYELTLLERYGAATTGLSISLVRVLQATAFTAQSSSAALGENAWSGSWSVSDTNYVEQQSCGCGTHLVGTCNPGTPTSSIPYTATADQLVLISADGANGTLVLTLTRH